MFRTILIITVLISAFFYTFSKDMGSTENGQMSVKKAAEISQLTSIGQVHQTIRAHQGRKIVVIMASWCPACNNYIPELLNKKYPKDVKIIMISIDKDLRKLRQYTTQLQTPNKIEWISIASMCKKTYCENTAAAFGRMGIMFNGSIPNMTIFNRQNGIINRGSPLSYAECIINKTCSVKCANRRCVVKNL